MKISSCSAPDRVIHSAAIYSQVTQLEMGQASAVYTIYEKLRRKGTNAYNQALRGEGMISTLHKA